jgi:hypothetical protein
LEKHLLTDNVAVITSFITSDSDDRPTKQKRKVKSQNKESNDALSRDLQRLAYGFNRVVGYYDENQQGNPTKEQSFFVICPKSVSYENFADTLIALARKYEQQSVVIWDCESQSAELWGTDDYVTYEKWNTYHSFNIDKITGDAWSKWKKYTIEFPSTKEIESATELSECGYGPAAMLAAKHYRERLLEEYGDI